MEGGGGATQEEGGGWRRGGVLFHLAGGGDGFTDFPLIVFFLGFYIGGLLLFLSVFFGHLWLYRLPFCCFSLFSFFF